MALHLTSHSSYYAVRGEFAYVYLADPLRQAEGRCSPWVIRQALRLLLA